MLEYRQNIYTQTIFTAIIKGVLYMKLKKTIYYVIAAVLALCPFVITFTAKDDIYVPMVMTPPQHIEMEKGLILFFALLVLTVTASKYVRLKSKSKKLSIVLSVFFGMCIIFGKSYEEISSWDYVFSSFSAFLASVAILCGYALIFYYFIGALLSFIEKYDTILTNNSTLKLISDKIEKIFAKKSLLKIWLILMIFWLPYLIIDYPAVIHADSGIMLGEYLNNNLGNHHPVLQTIFWGGFVEFGYKAFGSYNIGVFLFVLIQFLYGSFITALLFDYVYNKKYPVAIIALMLIIVAVMPAFSRNATAVCKDSNHTFYFMLMLWLIMKTIDLKDKIWSEGKNRYLIVLWVLTLLLVSFSKKSGVYVVIITLPFLLIYLRKYKKAFAVAALSFIVALGAYYTAEYYIENVLNISNDDTKEMYSIPFQQTARYTRDYAADVTRNESSTINKVLEYGELAELYNPELSDPVKNTFKPDSTGEDFSAYLGVWFKQLFKHPTVYIQATLNNIYGYFYPENIGYYKDLFFMTQCVDENMIFAPDFLKNISYKLRDVNMKFRDLPVIGLFSSLGFFVWTDIFITLYFMLYKKDKRFVVYNIPVIVTLLTCIASPANNTMRYGLPIMFSVPVLFCMVFSNEKENSASL